ncbi:MAG: hypothetical protein QG608_307 [Actinomycetota bacterium]|nr:hypothetical protein [Actinomycetota bacterium]
MTHQEASAVVSVPMDVIEHKLQDVESWPGFLIGVEEVRKTSFERYVFVVRDGRNTREVPVSVVDRPQRWTWHSLSGPTFEGELRMYPVDTRRTRLVLKLTSDPAGFLAYLAEMLIASHSTADVDLQRLERELTAPDPTDPGPADPDPAPAPDDRGSGTPTP